MKKLIAILLFSGLFAHAQTLTFPALSTNNTFTGTNTFNSPVSVQGTLGATGGGTLSGGFNITANSITNNGNEVLNGGTISGAPYINIRGTNQQAQNFSDFQGQNFVPWNFEEVYTLPTPGGFQSYQLLSLGMIALDGGFNINQNGQVNKTSYENLLLFQNSYTPGQHIPFGIITYNYSNGDSLGQSIQIHCWSGRPDNGGEGCEAQDNWVLQGDVEYTGTCASGCTTGSTSVTVTPTQGAGTQGQARWLVDSTKAVTNTVSAVSGTPPTITLNSAITASTVSGTLGTAITFTVAQASKSVTFAPTVTTGACATITTSSVLTIADAGALEYVIPTNVSCPNITVTFTRPHVSGATFSMGGTYDGQFASFAADQLNNASFASNLQTLLTGTTRQMFPVTNCPSTTTCILWVSILAAYQPYPGLATSGNNSITIYPGAEITSVRNGGTTLTNTLTLSPNAAAWATSDTLILPLYPLTTVTGGTDVRQMTLPSAAGAQGSALPTQNIYGLPSNNFTVVGAINNAPTNLYSQAGAFNSTIIPPHFNKAVGPFSDYISAGSAPKTGIINLGSCSFDATACGAAAQFYIVRAVDAAGSDQIYFEPASSRYTIQAGNNSARYIFDPSGLIPFPAATLNSGTVGLPFAHFIFGAAANQTTTLTSAATGNTTATFPNNTGTVAELNFAQSFTATQTLNNAPVAGGTGAALTGTGACATITTQTGGSWAGRATCTGATAASTLIITPGTTAPNGWVCVVQDQTTRANLLQQTSTTATACTLTATSVTQNDVFVFTATAF